jgi:hypothetical protein
VRGASAERRKYNVMPGNKAVVLYGKMVRWVNDLSQEYPERDGS